MSKLDIIDRRAFLRRASSTALTLPLIGLGLVELTSCASATSGTALTNSDKASPGSWRTTICTEKEPGEPLIVSGTIYAPDGRTPMEGITLFVYQTDATGVYTTSGGDNRNTRLHGSMRSNAEGKYEFRTIKPGSYPGSTNPAHIHAYVSGPGYPEYWIDEYHFDDDRFISDEQKRTAAAQGSFSPILKLTRGSDGVDDGEGVLRLLAGVGSHGLLEGQLAQAAYVVDGQPEPGGLGVGAEGTGLRAEHLGAGFEEPGFGLGAFGVSGVGLLAGEAQLGPESGGLVGGHGQAPMRKWAEVRRRSARAVR